MVIDLDNVLISRRVHDSWMGTLSSNLAGVMRKLAEKNITITADDIPDEQFRTLDDESGAGEIFVAFPGGIEVKMRVPADEWEINE